MRRSRKGAMLVFLAILLPVVLAVCAYAINVVYMELARTEIQISVDLASRAAARTLASTGDKQQARAQAQRLLDANPCLKTRIELSPNDVTFGVAIRHREDDRYTFKNGPTPNAIQLKSRQQFKLPVLFPTAGVPISVRPVKSTIAAQSEMDIALLLDRSSSMSYAYNELSHESDLLPKNSIPGFPVGLNSRWLSMVTAVSSTIQLMSASIAEEQMSLTTFSDVPLIDSQLTNNYGQISSALAFHSAAYVGGRSDLSLGMLSAASTLTNKSRARKWATRVLVIVSDGNTTSALEAKAIAQDLASQGITIFTVSCSVDSNVPLMTEIAKIGHGKHFHSSTAAEFLNAFKEISRSLPTLITN
ncbi:MAG: VWA domain-containing protein [Pirellula sp.]|nr:VWA domain-containing protein [Pirellula sp.]